MARMPIWAARPLMVHEKLDNNPYMINGLIGAPIDFNAGF
eukprot:CAMPEP_0118858920 /NCGR_PEP_ID=MMETSP1163-20130328/5387_1 /TAXON_ID=124430 /ORGANISM="Phaeomonas parva, Strain CCMP2877" /LENGTH=39 /DNA_ID= /DNA_START= /DNA_END= /DNA_ORIENTATION=